MPQVDGNGIARPQPLGVTIVGRRWTALADYPIMQTMKLSRVLFLAASTAFGAAALGSTGLTSAGVDPNANNNAAQNEPTLAQVAPAQNGASGATAGNAAAPAGATPNIAGAAGSTPGGPKADPHAAGGVPVAAAPPPPAPPPPPPDPSTLPVSVIRPVNKAPAADATTPAPAQNAPNSDISAVPTDKAQRRASAPPPQPATNTPAAPPAGRNAATGNARTDTGQLTSDKAVPAAAATTTPGATADGSANGYVFYMGSAIAGIILVLAFASFLRGGGSEGKPGG